MDKLLCCFVIGASTALYWPYLPDWSWLLIGLLLAILAYVRRYHHFAVTIIGMLWLQGYLLLHLPWLDNIIPQETQTLYGEVLRLESQEKSTRLWLRLERLDGIPLNFAPLVRLNSPQPLNITPGSEITATARLKPVHGLANRGGMDSRRLLLGQGVTATGSLKQIAQLTLAPPSWRARWLASATRQWQHLTHPALLSALTFGEQHGVSDADWALLRGGGLTHVIAISGQHIALVALLGVALFRPCHPLGAVIAGATLALGYSYLADFSLPVQRAMVMIGLITLLRCYQRVWPPHRIWLVALALLILWDPWALWSSGFWLSFLAVGLLTVIHYAYPKASLWQTQWIMLIGLLPLQLALFEGLAPFALFINYLALPLFGIVIIPAALLGVLFAPVWGDGAFGLFWIADQGIGLVLAGLAKLQAALPLWLPLPQDAFGLACLALLGYGLRFIPLGRWLGLVVVGLSIMMVFQPKPAWQWHILDVGQGLAVLVTQGNRALLYDTGDNFGDYNLATAAIFPVLDNLGIRHLDYLIISHGDKDHAGNRDLIVQQLAPRVEISSAAFDAKTKPCPAQDPMRWGELTLTFFSPLATSSKSNDRSCILKISADQHSLLLTGDAEQASEQALVATYGSQLASTLLVSGHHGSKTSSTAEFIAAVNPQGVIHSAGLLNQWGFPHPSVLQRYHGRWQWITGRDGAVTITPEGKDVIVTAQRRQGANWYQRPIPWWHSRAISSLWHP